jgi:hypothetical protein
MQDFTFYPYVNRPDGAMVARQIPVESCNLKVGRSNRSRVNRHLFLFCQSALLVILVECGWVVVWNAGSLAVKYVPECGVRIIFDDCSTFNQPNRTRRLCPMSCPLALATPQAQGEDVMSG